MPGVLQKCARLARAARVLARHGVLPPSEWLPLTPPPVRLLARLLPKNKAAQNGRSGQRLVRALTELGPSFIKAGQFLATRPDVIGPAIATDLEELQDRIPPFPLEQAQAILAAELGQEKAADIGALAAPVAAASIAQVHKVTRRTAPTPLALKILRPNIEDEFARDLSAFAWAANIVEKLDAEARRLKPLAFVETLARSVALEMDLRLEAAAAAEMATNTAADPEVRIPAVDWDFTSKRVLATEWIDGTPLRDREALIARGHDPRRLATNLMQAFLRHALRDGFFHADMHPGNLFVDERGRLVMVDFGIMGRLDPRLRRFMAETLAGFLARDYQRVARIHVEIGFVPATHAVEDFAQALRAIGEPIFGRPASTMSMARLLAQLFEVTRLFEMPMQPQLVMLQKTMVVVEGVARQLDPEHSIWDASRPVIERWMVDSLGPEARLKDASAGLASLGRALAVIPEALEGAARMAMTLQDQGVRLHPETARQIGEASRNQGFGRSPLVWLTLLALAFAAWHLI